MSATTGERWRNSRFLVALIYFFSLLTFALALMLALLALGLEMPFTWGAIPKSAFALLAAYATMRGAAWQWRTARATARNEVRFESDAACILRAGQEPVRLPWADISSVARDGGAITIQAANDVTLSFDGYDFFMPSRLGKAIAARAGKEFQ